MKTIGVSVSQKENDVIRMYAVMCGESVSNIIRKIVIQEITFMKNENQRKPTDYDYCMLVPMDISIEQEERLIEANYNKIRTVLGLKKIKLS